MWNRITYHKRTPRVNGHCKVIPLRMISAYGRFGIYFKRKAPQLFWVKRSKPRLVLSKSRKRREGRSSLNAFSFLRTSGTLIAINIKIIVRWCFKNSHRTQSDIFQTSLLSISLFSPWSKSFWQKHSPRRIQKYLWNTNKSITWLPNFRILLTNQTKVVWEVIFRRCLATIMTHMHTPGWICAWSLIGKLQYMRYFTRK